MSTTNELSSYCMNGQLTDKPFDQVFVAYRLTVFGSLFKLEGNTEKCTLIKISQGYAKTP